MRMSRRDVARYRSLKIESLEVRYALDKGFAALTANARAAALVDDTYEENDTFATAKSLGTITGTKTISGLVMADTNDFFKFTTTAAGTSTSRIVMSFTHSAGDLDIILYNSAGQQLKISQGVTNTETISLSGLAAGTYTARVYGYRGVTNPAYSLAFTTPGTTTPPTGTIDLAGAAFSAPNSATWGSSIAITASVRNSGNTAAGSFREQWYLSRNTTYSTDDVALNLSTGVNYATVAGLGAGATTAVNATLVLPSALPSGWTGTSFYLVMRTDSAGTVAESNENNNGGQVGAGLDNEAITITTVTTPPNTSGFTITLNMTGLTATQQAIFQQAAARWSQAIIGDLPNVTYNGAVIDDVLINASAVAIDGAGGVLGQAGPDRVRSSSQGGLPYLGTMQFDSADMASMQANGSLYGVILHEMGHVLGIGTLWSSRSLVTGTTGTNPRFTGAQATAAYNAIFGRNDTSVPVEGGGGSGTRNAHWRESVFTSELMTGWASGAMQMSRVTIASLADIGYVVNMNAADAFTPSTTAAGFLVAGNSRSAALLNGLASLTIERMAESFAATFDREAFFSALSERGNSSASLTTLSRSSSAISSLAPLTRANARLNSSLGSAINNGLGQRFVSSTTAEAGADCGTEDSATLDLIFGEEAADWRV